MSSPAWSAGSIACADFRAVAAGERRGGKAPRPEWSRRTAQESLRDDSCAACLRAASGVTTRSRRRRKYTAAMIIATPATMPIRMSGRGRAACPIAESNVSQSGIQARPHGDARVVARSKVLRNPCRHRPSCPGMMLQQQAADDVAASTTPLGSDMEFFSRPNHRVRARRPRPAALRPRGTAGAVRSSSTAAASRCGGSGPQRIDRNQQNQLHP